MLDGVLLVQVVAMDGNADAGVVEEALYHIVVGLNLEEGLGQTVEEDKGAKRTEREDELAGDGLVKMILKGSPACFGTRFRRRSDVYDSHNLMVIRYWRCL